MIEVFEHLESSSLDVEECVVNVLSSKKVNGEILRSVMRWLVNNKMKDVHALSKCIQIALYNKELESVVLEEQRVVEYLLNECETGTLQ